ncbi:MAG TPA: hypothetical protein VK674_00500 [Candidatus Limnocylindria bacterium]|nr:hypothetical protein [Candidatus Limnocylindria bacterium]
MNEAGVPDSMIEALFGIGNKETDEDDMLATVWPTELHPAFLNTNKVDEDDQMTEEIPVETTPLQGSSQAESSFTRLDVPAKHWTRLAGLSETASQPNTLNPEER